MSRFNVIGESKGREKEKHIERKIDEYHERGVCDRRGHSIPVEERSCNLDSRHRIKFGDFRQYQTNYERIKW